MTRVMHLKQQVIDWASVEYIIKPRFYHRKWNLNNGTECRVVAWTKEASKSYESSVERLIWCRQSAHLRLIDSFGTVVSHFSRFNRWDISQQLFFHIRVKQIAEDTLHQFDIVVMEHRFSIRYDCWLQQNFRFRC